MRKSASLLLTVFGLGLGSWALHARAQSPGSQGTRATAAADLRWKESFEAFAAADKLHAPAAGGVLFVGSSSIRMWDGLEQAFDLPTSQAVLKRGFGGSRLQDCAERVEQLVLPYKPRLVVVYAGDNDLAEGRTPQQVMESFASFVETVRSSLPDTRIAYVSIKPSPLRSNLLESIRETNSLIAGYARTAPNLDFIDIYSRMLDDAGRPRADLFQPDALHLNATGYALWRSVIGPHLLQAGARTATAGAAPAAAGATPASVTEPAMVSTMATVMKAPPTGR